MDRRKKYIIPWSIYLGILIGFGLVKYLLNSTGIEFRLWVQAVFWMLVFFFPVLTIGYYLLKIKYKVLAAVSAVLWGILALLGFLFGFLVFMTKAPAEYDIGSGMLSVAEQVTGGYGNISYTYWDKVSVFARKQFEWNADREKKLLERKYGLAFHVSKDGYTAKEYPSVTTHILQYPRTSAHDFRDDFLNGIKTYYFEKTYSENGFTSESTVENTNGMEEYLLIVKDWSSRETAAKEGAQMIADAVKDPVFADYQGHLNIRIEISNMSKDCILRFGKGVRTEAGEDAPDYYGEQKNVKTALLETYNAIMDSLPEEEMLEQGIEDTQQENQNYWETMKGAFQYLFDAELSKEYSAYDERYNAKGNFYAVLSKDGENFEVEGSEIRVVYDRVSDDGKAKLFVMFRGEAIVTGYYVDAEAQVIEKYEVNW